ncbi:MAG: cadmium-translocating P-type ATPase [Rickettsiales bacterium]|jgi:heavy metal translocating P-type ATPase|nr:cadmium-translocating P-type ATPase [Rickettsiales bacterium]
MNTATSTKTSTSLPLASRWHIGLLAASLVSIALHFALGAADLPAVAGITAVDIPLLAVIIIGGIPLLIQISSKLFKGSVGADFLGAIELVAAALLDQYLAAILIIIMLSGGQALEAYAMRKASSVLRALSDRMPSKAHRKHGAKVEEIALADIAIGDEIVVFPHETAPVDGIVVEGQGSMDESYLTGEPYRVSKAPGAAVLSGAINGEAVLTIRAEKLAHDSRYAQIMEVMQEAEQKRPQLRRLGDQLGGAFAVFALIVSGIVWLVTGDALRFLSVLVIATPCPLIIAIPITIIGAISMAARLGIIIKDPTVLERLPTCRTAIFDKTGTLTYGKPELTEILPAAGLNADDILGRAASLERYSKHPLASAILQAAEKAKLVLIEAASVSEKPGQGLTGMVAGHEIAVTSRKKLLQLQPELKLPPTAAGLESIIVMDGKYAATLRFRDAPRSDGKSFIGHLAPSHQFNKIMLVSGDRESEVAYLAELLGIKETLASQSPEQKVTIVREETAKAPTLFMGDGINDAPALASATVGIAFGQHSSVTAEAAGVVIMENSLAKVDELLHISTRLRLIALQSAIGGMALSLIGMGFAAAGYISPVQAALFQEFIDVLAIANALRLSLGKRIETDMNR